MPGGRPDRGALLVGTMAMEPAVLTCDACGARVRTIDPAQIPGRPCPRCRTPFPPAIPRSPGVGDPAARSARWRPALAASLALTAAVASIALREPALAAMAGLAHPGDPPPSATIEVGPDAVEAVPALAEPAAEPAAPESEAPEDPAVPDLAEIPAEAPVALALRGEVPGGSSVPRADAVVPPPPQPPAGPGPDPAPPELPKGGEPRRLLVGDIHGRAVVARELGWHKGRMAVLLPDGQIGWPDGLVDTDRPFVPLKMDELRKSLQDAEFPTFRVEATKHYLVFYQGSEPFAKASGALLERLYDTLTDTLKRFRLPVVPAEFPLVAVIFRNEEDFRASRAVAADVQAFYEIHSNRIFFYEKSSRDDESPEVAALRKPQTVAHEGTHQILHNVGIQARSSSWPLWLVEGFAEYCSPPKATKKGTDWAGLGQINPLHLATIHDLDDPLTTQVKGRASNNVVARNHRVSLVEDLVTRKDLTPTDYALSWGLTHYLARQQVDPFVAYLRKLCQLKPFEVRTPDQQLATFREAFGDDLAGLEARVGKYLARLKVPDSMALPYYAVLFEQPIGQQAIRRSAMVSQSPSVIRQWLESAALPQGGPGRWHAVPGPTRSRAFLTADQWMAEIR